MTIEVIRRVLNENERCYITIGPSPDFPNENVRIWTDNPNNIEFFGKIDLDLPYTMIRELAKAMVACADDVEFQ